MKIIIKNHMRVADFVIKFLEDKGIKNVFTVSGGGSIFLCDALYKSKKLNYVGKYIKIKIGRIMMSIIGYGKCFKKPLT